MTLLHDPEPGTVTCRINIPVTEAVAINKVYPLLPLNKAFMRMYQDTEDIRNDFMDDLCTYLGVSSDNDFPHDQILERIMELRKGHILFKINGAIVSEFIGGPFVTRGTPDRAVIPDGDELEFPDIDGKYVRVNSEEHRVFKWTNVSKVF